jgi:hypothetical protein
VIVSLRTVTGAANLFETILRASAVEMFWRAGAAEIFWRAGALVADRP